MVTIRLVHWKAAEAEEPIRRLQSLGYGVNSAMPSPPDLVKELIADPPSAVVIDLSRLPSHGSELGVLLRMRKGTRAVPLVFVGGEAEKVDRIRGVLPDATFTTWEGIAAALQKAIRAPVQRPVVPESAFAPYAGKPLADKLGIRAKMRVALLGAPPGFERLLGVLPLGAKLVEGETAGADLYVWFVRRRQELDVALPRLAQAIASNPLWIAWPKKASAEASDLVQQDVREAGLAAGLVDYKICSVDSTWSALLFRRRRGG
jgi:CheY-like chemotaxis protein